MPEVSGGRRVVAAAIVFVACLLATWGWTRRENVDAPSPAAGAHAPDVGARGPARAPSFVPSSPPRVGAAPAPPAEELDDDARHALAVAQEGREGALRAAVFGLADDPSETIETRLGRYRTAIASALGEAGLGHMLAYRGALLEAFLRNDSVQAELAALPPGARRSQVDRIRAEFGYDEAALERMRRLDERREERWERGRAYMEERAGVARTFEGEALEEELRHLREEHFGREAPTIEREEEAGFFRYERPRVYGRN